MHYLIEHTTLFLVLFSEYFFFIRDTIRKHFPRAIVINPLLDLRQPRVLFSFEILRGDVGQIDNRFSGKEVESLQVVDLFVGKLFVPKPLSFL